MALETLGILGLSAGGLAAVLGITYMRVAPIIPFLYSNARINARANYMLSGTKIDSLAESKTTGEMVNSMTDSDYAQYIESTEDIWELHASIEKGFLESIKELQKSSPEQIHGIFNSYMGFWEAKIIKTFYRQRFTQKDFEQIDKTIVFPVGTLTVDKIKRLNETKTIADMKVVLGTTVYSKAFDKEYDSLEEFEIAIDNIVFDEFVKSVQEAKIADKNVIINLFNTKFDILNLLVLLKCEARDIDEDKRKRLLIQNNSALFGRVDDLVYAKDVADLVEKTKGLPYYKVLEEALEIYNKDKSLSNFEKGLLKYYKNLVESQELAHFQGPFPLIAYLVKKELEQRNLLVISKGIEAGFTSSEIKELIV
ncbi:MAG: V-type ATPase subunit [Candidatus Diapherotrites archaeon]